MSQTSPSNSFQIFTLLLQFLFVTVGGAILTFLWNSLRDEEARRQGVLNTLRELAADIDEYYRAQKQIKRLIRAQLKVMGPEGCEIDASAFERRMEALSDVQLKIEMVRNAVRTIPEMIGRARINKIVTYLDYSADYLHDVVEEFEKRLVTRREGVCNIGLQCVYIHDFLGPRWKPAENGPDDAQRAWIEFRVGETLSSETTSFAARFASFKTLISHPSIEISKRRVKSISDECMLQAMRELRQEIVMNKPLVSLRVLRRWPSTV